MGIDKNQINDELTISDVINFIKLNSRILLIGALMGGLLGLVISMILPARWEASTLIQVGQLADSGNGIQAIGSQAIESPLLVLDRIKSKSFQNDVLVHLGMPTSEKDKEAESFRTLLKVKLEKSNLIRVSVQARSQQEAGKLIDGLINVLKKIHLKISTPTINRWKTELLQTQQKLETANSESIRLEKLLQTQDGSLNDLNFSRAALMSNILLLRGNEVKNLRIRESELEDFLSPVKTYETNQIGRIEISEDPLFPNKPIFCFIGFLMGLFFSAVWRVFRPVELHEN
ncbi:MAG TPA: hypothetical protein PL131_02720 [Methylotenera sp.]|nr:hypothetical protein [Methylotenera sp.]